ncbi:MAG: hypothetical protein IT236_11495 [Bacteroidia bacterium]|nr:hypothetical protein [Bacteroidia bacterium]
MFILKRGLLIAFLSVLFTSCFGQDDLLSLLDEKKDEGPKKVYATFKTLRVGNAQSIETVKKKHLDFRIAHRFGNLYNSDSKNPINETFQTFLGFDLASDIRMSFDYGLTENFSIGIGRSKNKLIDGSFKWRILTQTTDFSTPFSLALYSNMGYLHARPQDMYSGIIKDFKTSELHRLNYFTQAIIASKLNNWLSLELLPSYMYRNFIKENVNNNGEADVNGFFSMGIAGRVKLTKRLSLIGDYFYNFPAYYRNNSKAYNPLSLGFEIETGGHVFSLFYTNASYLIENNFIPYTTDTWAKGQVKFGFCISRTFSL